MRVDECYQIGYIAKTHGLRGEVNVILDVDNPENYFEMESVFLEREGQLVPFFISHQLNRAAVTILRFEGIEGIEEAKELVGSRIYLPLSVLPGLPDGKFYYHDLVGLKDLRIRQSPGSDKINLSTLFSVPGCGGNRRKGSFDSDPR